MGAPENRKEQKAAGNGAFSASEALEGEPSFTPITDPDELEAARLAYESEEREALERLAEAMKRSDNHPGTDPLGEVF